MAVALCSRTHTGTQRLGWKCVRMAPISACLNHYLAVGMWRRQTHPTGQNHASADDLGSGIVNKGISTSIPDLNNSSASTGSAYSRDSSGTYVGSNVSQIFTNPMSSLHPVNSCLELCIHVVKYETNLAEIPLASNNSSSSIFTDAHLFQHIYNQYYSMRRHIWRRWLYRPNGIKSVHFGV